MYRIFFTRNMLPYQLVPYAVKSKSTSLLVIMPHLFQHSNAFIPQKKIIYHKTKLTVN